MATKSRKYSYYSIQLKRNAPFGTIAFHLPGWDYSIHLGKERSYYEPTLTGVHKPDSVLRTVADIKYLRLSEDEAADMKKYLAATPLSKKIPANTISAALEAQTAETSDVRLKRRLPQWQAASVMLSVYIEFRQSNPRGWEDLERSERYLHLFHPTRKSDYACGVAQLPPVTPDEQEKLNIMLLALTESDLPTAEALAIMNDSVTESEQIAQ